MKTKNLCATYGCRKPGKHREFIRDIDGTGRCTYLYFCDYCYKKGIEMSETEKKLINEIAQLSAALCRIQVYADSAVEDDLDKETLDVEMGIIAKMAHKALSDRDGVDETP